MEQVEQILAGERDYALIKGGTGPLWYTSLECIDSIVIPLDMYGYTLHYTKLLPGEKTYSPLKSYFYYSTSPPSPSPSPSIEL
jgi:hypothetical protein